jgi:hypothetical protein
MTYYIVTDRRALVVCNAWGGLIHQLNHDQGELLALRGPGGYGKIQFGRTAISSMDVILFGRAAVPGFYGLRGVKPVFDILRGQRDIVEE